MTPPGDATWAFQQALLDDDPAALYDSAPCGYLSTAIDGTLLKVNETFLTWIGHSADELVGRRRFVELLSPGSRIYHETHVSPMLHALTRVKEIALDVVTADGGRLPVLVNAVLDRSLAGEPRIIRIALFDATERRRYEQELLSAKHRAEQSERHAVRLARTLQQTLIPPTTPQIPGLQVAAAYRAAGRGDEVGGDFYDVFQLSDGDWVATLGDVCGKGVDAAVVTSLVRHTVRALAVSETSPRNLLHQLNAVLLASSDADRFCTVVVIRLHRTQQGWTATTSSGGHPLPLLLRAGTATTVGDFGTLVGAVDDPHYSESTVLLGEGDALFVYTDGVSEARRGDDFLGDQRVQDLATGPGDADALVQRVLDEVLAFQDQLPRDDVALLAVRVPGQ